MFAYDGSLGSAATGHSGASAHCRDSHTTQQETSRALACTPLRGLLAAEGPQRSALRPERDVYSYPNQCRLEQRPASSSGQQIADGESSTAN
jgi:hypothetical protein